MSESNVPLSPEGIQQRERILRLAQREARSLKHRRHSARIGGACIILAVIALGLMLIVPGKPPVRMVKSTPAPPPPAVQQTPGIVVTFIQTDPTLADRLAIRPQPPRWRSIDDDELLTSLADAGQPAGLIYVNGKALLLPRQTAQR